MQPTQSQEPGGVKIPLGGYGLVRRPLEITPRQPSLLRNTTTPNAVSEFSVAIQSQKTYNQILPPGAFSKSLQPPKSNGTLSGSYDFQRPAPESFERAPSTPRGVGRPPSNPSSPRVEIPSSGLKRRGRPRKEVDYTIPPIFTLKARRGRPMSTPEGAAKAAAKAERRPWVSQAPKKRGRPHKKFTHTFIHRDPEYLPFLCEWEDCPAELVNFETLRAHVFTVHVRQRGKLLHCCWAKCREAHEEEEASDAAATNRRPSFNSERTWKDHVNEAHLIPFVWHMGDGPKATWPSESFRLGNITPNNITDEILERPTDDSWLFDDNGTQVTPSVKGQLTEFGYAKLNNKRRFVKRRDHNGEFYFEPIGSESYVRVQVITEEEEDVPMSDEGKVTGLAVVLNPGLSPKAHRKSPEYVDSEDDRMMGYRSAEGLASEMETD